MANFFAELKRRHVYRVAAAYAVIAWVLLQLTANVAPILDLPPWIARTVLMLLAIGFPLILFFAWVHQLTPEGGGPIGKVVTGRLDWCLIGALVIVIALAVYQQVAPTRATTAAQQPGVDAARTASAAQASVSIAVLPFENLSGDASQEFFSDGMTEEITSALAKVPDLKVVARTSAFQFKNQNRDIQSIGQQLHATHFIEGSVRKAGNRVRITAQLINAADGTHIWSEDYDRQLTDIFAVQEEIARAITTSLRMPLGLKPGENLVNNRSIDPESYQQYLRAKALYQGRLGSGVKGLDDAIALLEQILARNPDYPPAWVLLADTYNTRPNYSGAASAFRTVSVDELKRVIQSSQSKAEAAARKAIQLDANQSGGYRNLAAVQIRTGKLVQGEELLLKALSLDSSDPQTLTAHSNFLASVGRVKEALSLSKQVLELEPFIPINNLNMAVVLWLNGQGDPALEILRMIGGNDTTGIAIIQASGGHYKEAADTLLPSRLGGAPEDVRQEAVRLLRLAPAKVASPQSVKRLGGLDWVYLYVGAPEQVLEYYETNVQIGWSNLQHRFLSHPAYGPMRKTERYKAYARKAGLVDYWRAKGWPEFCRPIGADDFVCD